MCNKFEWSTIDFAEWKDVPYLKNQPATEMDVKFGRAVFYIEGDGVQSVGGYKLPFLAELQTEDEKSKIVIVIQMETQLASVDVTEIASGDVIVGYRNFDGGNGIATLSEIKLISSNALDVKNA
jgi:hypothetical protein